MHREHLEKAEIVVLGAGVCGLAAADKLVSQGKEVIVIEKEDDVGGLCRSFKQNGFTFDLGGHRLLPHNHETVSYINSFFPVPGDLSLRDRLSQIYLNGRFLTYPPEFMDILNKLGLSTCIRSGLDSLYFRMKHVLFNPPEISLKDWMLNRFGPLLYSIYFGPYSYKLWGRSTSSISSDWASQRISVPNLIFAFKKLFFKNGNEVKSYANKFLYPNGGIGEIPNRLAGKLTLGGGKIIVGHRLIGIIPHPEGLIVRVCNSQGQTKEFLAKKVISTIPLNEFVSSLNPLSTKSVLDAAEGLSFRSVRFLNLMIDAAQVTANSWFYIPERKFIFFRIQETSNWHPNNCPQGKTGLTFEIACDEGGRLWKMSDQDLFKCCMHDISKLGIHIENKILGYFCTAALHAYPIYALNYKNNLRMIYNYIKSLKNIAIAGRQGLFRYMNMDASIENGILAAESLSYERKREELFTIYNNNGYLEKEIYLKSNEQ